MLARSGKGTPSTSKIFCGIINVGCARARLVARQLSSYTLSVVCLMSSVYIIYIGTYMHIR